MPDSLPPETFRRIPRWAGPAVLVVAALALTWPAAVTGYFPGRVDDLHNYYSISWLLHAWREGTPASRMNMFGGELPAYFLSEQFAVPSVVALVLTAAGIPLLKVYTGLYFLFSALNALAGWFLARSLLESRVLAVCSALLFAFGGFAAHDLHQVLIRLPVFTLPLVLLLSVRVLEAGTPRDTVRFSSVMLLQSVLPLGYSLMALIVVAAAIGAGGSRRNLLKLLLAAAPALAVLGVTYVNYTAGFRVLDIALAPAAVAERFPGLFLYALSLPSLLAAALTAAALLAGISGLCRAGACLPEASGTTAKPFLSLTVALALLLLAAGTGLARFLFQPETLSRFTLDLPGLVWPSVFFYLATGLALIVMRTRLKPLANLDLNWSSQTALFRAAVLVAILGFMLTLNHVIHPAGTDILFGPIAGWQFWCPPLGSMRSPPRFGLLLAVTLPVIGFRWLETVLSRNRSDVRNAVILAAALVTTAEIAPVRSRYAPFRENRLPLLYAGLSPTQEEGFTVPEVYHALAEMTPGLVAELPVQRKTLDQAGALAAAFSTVHWFPLLNGYSSYYPGGYIGRMLTADRADSRGGGGLRDWLGKNRVRYLIVHAHRLAAGERERYEAALSDSGIRRFTGWPGVEDWLVDLHVPGRTGNE